MLGARDPESQCYSSQGPSLFSSTPADLTLPILFLLPSATRYSCPPQDICTCCSRIPECSSLCPFLSHSCAISEFSTRVTTFSGSLPRLPHLGYPHTQEHGTFPSQDLPQLPFNMNFSDCFDCKLSACLSSLIVLAPVQRYA